MTPALKAMVEAMADQMPGAMISNGEVLVTGAGWVNLEKVARAGLEAIREPDETIRAGGAAADAAADPFIGTEHEGVPADPANAAEHWWFMIGAILGEKP